MLSILRMRSTRRLKYIFIEVALITIGLLLTLAINNLVEWRQHQNLVAEARKALRLEITKSVATIDKALGDIDDQLVKTRATLAMLQTFQSSRNTPKEGEFEIAIKYLRHTLSDTSWKTSQATGALSYMPYGEAEAYSTIYSFQAAFTREELVIVEDLVQILATTAELNDGTSVMTASAASTLARPFGMLLGHLLSLKSSALVISTAQHAFLEGRSVHMTISVDENIAPGAP